MSAPVTAATATKGDRYTDKGGNVVEFLGPSARFARMYSIRVVETQRTLDSVPGDYTLFPISATELAARDAIATIKGQPRDVLEPALRNLDDDALDALILADTRLWVAQAVSELLDRRRVSVTAPAIAPTTAPAITIPLVPKTGSIDSLLDEVAASVQVQADEASRRHTRQELDAAVAEAREWMASHEGHDGDAYAALHLRLTEAEKATNGKGAGAEVRALICYAFLQIRDGVSTSDVVPESQVPESGARSTAYMRGRSDFAAGLPLDIIEAIQRDAFVSNDRAGEADYRRGWEEARDLVASEPGFVRVVVEPFLAPATEPAATPPAPEEPAPTVAVKVRRPPRYAEKLGALGYPLDVVEAMTAEAMRTILDAGTRFVPVAGDRPASTDEAANSPTEAPQVIAPIDELATADLPRSLALVAAAPLADLLLWTRAEATGRAREKVLDAIQARIASASDAEHEAAETKAHADTANTEERPAWFLPCPKCGAEVYWRCDSEEGATGSAHCSRSGIATAGPTPPSCDWRGTVVRVDAYEVRIGRTYLPRSALLAVEVSAPAPVPPPVAEAQAAYDASLPVLRFLAEAGVDLEGDDLDRFDQLVGSVRECSAALRGTEARHLPLIQAALVWATDHDAPATVRAQLEKRVRQLRGEPAPRRTTEAGPSAVVLSPAGEEQAAAIQAALARLSAAVPGYVAAVEALGALRSLGFQVVIDDEHLLRISAP